MGTHYEITLPPVLQSEVEQTEVARHACDVPSISLMSARDQEKLLRVYLVRHGSALGVANALLRTHKISEVAYGEAVTRLMSLLGETTVVS